MVLEYRAKLNPEQQSDLDDMVTKYQSRNASFNSTGKADEPKKK